MTVNAGKEEHTDVVDQFKKWKNLKKASFSYNELHSIDYSIVRSRNVYTDWYFYKKLVKELNREIGHTFVRNHCWLSQVFHFSKNQGKPYYPRNEKNDNAEGISCLDSYFFYTISFFFFFFLVRIFPHSDWIWQDTEYLSVFSPNAAKYRPEKTLYLDTFQAVVIIMCQEKRSKPLWNENWSLFNE